MIVLALMMMVATADPYPEAEAQPPRPCAEALGDLRTEVQAADRAADELIDALRAAGAKIPPPTQDTQDEDEHEVDTGTPIEAPDPNDCDTSLGERLEDDVGRRCEEVAHEPTPGPWRDPGP